MKNYINDEKKLFASFSEAEKVAEKMSRTHNEGFNVYKVHDMWAVGGVHLKNNNKQKIKSFDDLRIILNEFVSDKDDSSVDDYIKVIENDLQDNENTIQGENTDWILKDIKILLGKEIGMSVNNNNSYLVLFIERGHEKLSIKMGGNFSSHIPLIQRQANSLINSKIIWHTWNSKSSNWKENAWFYRIEKKL